LQELASNGHALNGSVELHLSYDEEVGGEIGPRWLRLKVSAGPTTQFARAFVCGLQTAHNGCLHLEVTYAADRHAAMPESGIDAWRPQPASVTPGADSRCAPL